MMTSLYNSLMILWFGRDPEAWSLKQALHRTGLGENELGPVNSTKELNVGSG